jgi:hypothetical protein
MKKGWSKMNGRKRPRKKRAVSSKRQRSQKAYLWLRWSGWPLFVAAMIWIFFGNEIVRFFAKILEDPLSIGHALVELFGWVRLITELILKAVFKKD